MSRAVFRTPAPGGDRAAATPAAVISLTAEARRQGGGQGPASERESAIHTARALIGEASRRRAQGAFHAWLLRAAANQRRRASGLDYQLESVQLGLFGGVPHGR